MKERTKISVAVITYNQEKTLAQTLDSILMQKGDFDLELVIGEDCSTDGTLAICQEYVRKVESGEWRDKSIKLLSGPKNLGITANYFRTLQACTGEFIGDIAGDDYYCDDHALEKQLRYMQAHPEVGVMGANGYSFFVKRNEKIEGLNPVVKAADSKVKEFYFSSSYQGGVYFKPVGTMLRRSLLRYIDFDEIIRRKLPVEDYPMQAIWSRYTKFASLPDLMVVYRIYEESSTFMPLDNPKFLSYHKGLMNIRRYLNELFPNDACFSEEQLLEYEFYKEFLLYLHRFDYKRAKLLIDNAPKEVQNGVKVRQAKRFTKSRVHFLFAYIIKEYKYKQELKRNT